MKIPPPQPLHLLAVAQQVFQRPLRLYSLLLEDN